MNIQKIYEVCKEQRKAGGWMNLHKDEFYECKRRHRRRGIHVSGLGRNP